MNVREELCDLGLEDSIVFDSPDYDTAIIGYTSDGRIVYDYERMVESLITREGWTEEEAREWIDYNTLGAYLGPGTPVVMFPLVR